MPPDDGDVDFEIGLLGATLRVDSNDDLGLRSQRKTIYGMPQPFLQPLASDEAVPLLERLAIHLPIHRELVQAQRQPKIPGLEWFRCRLGGRLQLSQAS